MPRFSPTPLTVRVLLALLLLLPLAACDETTGLDASVDVVVDDAVAAREGGDVAAAVALLEGAFERAPESAEVRVELATTLLQRDGLDLLDLDRVSRFLTSTSGADGRMGAARGAGCAAAADPTARPFDPVDVEGFEEWVDKVETLTRAGELLEPVIPAELQGFDVCTSVVDGALSYDRDGALAALAAQGLSPSQVAQALAVNALSRFLEAYVFVADEMPQATWYRLADGSIAICADDEQALRQSAQAAVRDVGEAVLSLDARAALLGAESVAAEIVEQALDAYQDLRGAVADFCDA